MTYRYWPITSVSFQNRVGQSLCIGGTDLHEMQQEREWVNRMKLPMNANVDLHGIQQENEWGGIRRWLMNVNTDLHRLWIWRNAITYFGKLRATSNSGCPNVIHVYARGFPTAVGLSGKCAFEVKINKHLPVRNSHCLVISSTQNWPTGRHLSIHL